MNATNTVFDAKRLIGRKFTDPSVQADCKHWPFKVVSGPGGTPIIEVDYKGESKQFKGECVPPSPLAPRSSLLVQGLLYSIFVCSS